MQNIKKYRGTIVLVVMCAIPLALWLTQTSTQYEANLESILAFLGKSVALIGMTLFMLNPILSMRHAWLLRVLGDIGGVYRLHKSSGKLSLVLVMAHPLLLGGARLAGGLSLGALWNWTSLLVLSGIVALCAFIVLVFASLYAHITHQRWITVHRLFGLLIPLFLLHAYSAKSQIYQIQSLQLYVFTIGTLGFAAFLYRSVLHKVLVKKFHYVVEEIIHRKGNVTEVVLKPLGVPIAYVPGQFAYVSFISDKLSAEAHPYSFTTSNDGPYVRFAIKQLGDDTVALAQLLEVGTKAFLEGPYGEFSLHKAKSTNQVWVAGGIGITPFLSMARSLRHKTKHSVTLFYATKEIEDATFLEDLWDIAKLLPHNFTLHVIDGAKHGFITVELMEKKLKSLTSYDYLMCGPPAMITTLTDQLQQSSVDPGRIHSENFSV